VVEVKSFAISTDLSLGGNDRKNANAPPKSQNDLDLEMDSCELDGLYLLLTPDRLVCGW
jgi:hypothetical protein